MSSLTNDQRDPQTKSKDDGVRHKDLCLWKLSFDAGTAFHIAGAFFPLCFLFLFAVAVEIGQELENPHFPSCYSFRKKHHDFRGVVLNEPRAPKEPDR